MNNFGKVAVLLGGPSAEREISFLSGNAVLKALQEKGVDAHAFDPAERSIFELKRGRHQVEGEFVEVNCATIRGEGAMSALFGHVRGSFTGALRDRITVPGVIAMRVRVGMRVPVGVRAPVAVRVPVGVRVPGANLGSGEENRKFLRLFFLGIWSPSSSDSTTFRFRRLAGGAMFKCLPLQIQHRFD